MVMAMSLETSQLNRGIQSSQYITRQDSRDIELTSRQNSSPFFRMPRELRDKVYDLLFDPCRLEIKNGCTHASQDGQDERLKGIALLYTCRQAHVEVTDLLYAKLLVCAGDEVDQASCSLNDHRESSMGDPESTRNSTDVKDDHPFLKRCEFATLEHWLQAIGPLNRPRLRKLELYFQTNHRFTRSCVIGRMTVRDSRKVRDVHLQKALRLLSIDCALQTVDIVLIAPKEFEADLLSYNPSWGIMIRLFDLNLVLNAEFSRTRAVKKMRLKVCWEHNDGWTETFKNTDDQDLKEICVDIGVDKEDSEKITQCFRHLKAVMESTSA